MRAWVKGSQLRFKRARSTLAPAKMRLLEQMIAMALQSLQTNVHVDTGMSISTWTLLSRRVKYNLSFIAVSPPHDGKSPEAGMSQSSYNISNSGPFTSVIWSTDVYQYVYWENTSKGRQKAWKSIPQAIRFVFRNMFTNAGSNIDPKFEIRMVLPKLVDIKQRTY